MAKTKKDIESESSGVNDIIENARREAEKEAAEEEVRAMRLREQMEDVLRAVRKRLADMARDAPDDGDGFTLEIIADFFLSSLRTREEKHCPTMCTDGKSIMYGIPFLMKLYDEATCKFMASDVYSASSVLDETLTKLGIDTSNGAWTRFADTVAREAKKIVERDGSKKEPVLPGRHAVWKEACLAADPSFPVFEKGREAASALDVAFGEYRGKSGGSKIGKDAVNEFIALAAGIFLHEVLHIVFRDVSEDELFQSGLVRLSMPDPTSKRDEPAGRRLHELHNFAADAVINDTILNIFKGKLPAWCVKRDNARNDGTRFVYELAVHECCVEMASALEREYERPEGTVELEKMFRELFRESRKRQQEMIDQGFAKSGQEQSGQGQSGQEQNGQGQSGQGQSDQGQSGQGQSDQGQSGQGQSGQRQNGSGEGSGTSGKQGEAANGTGQTGDGSSSGNGANDRSNDASESGSGGGLSKDDLKGKLDWGKFNGLNPDYNITKGISKVFGGNVPPLSDEPPEVSDGADGNMEEDTPTLPSGEKVSDGNAKNGRPQPVDDHEQSSEERKKTTGIDGEDPAKETGELLKKVVKEHMEKSPDRLAGVGSMLASILVELSKKAVPKKRPFVKEMEQFLRRALSPYTRKTYGKPHKAEGAVNAQLAGMGAATKFKTSYRPKNKGHVLVAIDVSGSMGNEDVRAAALETVSLVNSIKGGHTVTIVQIDDGIVGWKSFKTGSREMNEFVSDIFKEGFERRGAGGTGYESLFNVLLDCQSKKNTTYGRGIPEDFGDGTGVPLRVPAVDAMVFCSDGGFSPELPLVDIKYLAWVCVPENGNFPQVKQGKVFDSKGVAIQVAERERKSASGPSRFVDAEESLESDVSGGLSL